MTEPAPPPPAEPARRRIPWTRALGVSVAAFALWLVFDAPTLQHNAQAQPVGARRTVSLDLLGPIATLSRGLQVSHVVSVADGVIGRNGNLPGNGSGPVTIGPLPHGGHGATSTSTTTTAPKGHPGTTGTTTTTLPASVVHPTAADPLRVLIVGDSLGIDMGQALQNDLANTGVVQATLDAKESTGLTRPEYYNWPAELQTDLTQLDPQIVVVMMGANDPQDFPGPPDIPYASAQWDQLYSQRVAAFMAEAASGGAKVLWVGMPPMQDPVLNQKMAHIDALDQAQAAANHDVTWISSWNILGGPQGVYTPYLEVNGQEVNVRYPDGTHIAPGGSELLAQAVMAQMRDHLHAGLPA